MVHMKLLALAVLLSAGLQAQTIWQVPLWDTANRRGNWYNLGQSFTVNNGVLNAVPQYVGGPVGAIITDNTKTPPEIDIVTSVVPRKGVSEVITGLWGFTQGMILIPMPMTTCDNMIRGRVILDSGDNQFKGCNGINWITFASSSVSGRVVGAILIASATDGSYTIPATATNVEVFRNGIRQVVAVDYTLTDGVIRPVPYPWAGIPIWGNVLVLANYETP